MKKAILILLVGLLWCNVGVALPKCQGTDYSKWTNCQKIFYYGDGSIYVGEWKFGKRHGHGTYTSKLKSKYVGEWKDDKRHGEGILTFADGRVREGIWKNGKLVTKKSVAILVSDILKKTQELAEKQKIKGKKLKEFILNNVITVDYEGKEQTYKFNKDITYEVYEDGKVVGEGSWAIKGLTKKSIKLSGYRNIYFQIYKTKEKISTLTNLKKSNDEQTNRVILKIATTNDFEEQFAQIELKKQKALEQKKKEEEEKKQAALKAEEEKKQAALKAEEEKKQAALKAEEEKKQAALKAEEERKKIEEEKKLLEEKNLAEGSLPPCSGGQDTYWTNCFGTYTWASGDKYVGEWKEDKKHGQGTYTWANGNKYVGEFKNAKRNGLGTYTFADGRIDNGIWKNNKLIEPN